MTSRCRMPALGAVTVVVKRPYFLLGESLTRNVLFSICRWPRNTLKLTVCPGRYGRTWPARCIARPGTITALRSTKKASDRITLAEALTPVAGGAGVGVVGGGVVFVVGVGGV